jgi:hypothetical protein
MKKKRAVHLSEIIWGLEIAQRNGWYGFVDITIPGQDHVESIVNHPSSLENKIKYYKENYNKDGSHKLNPNIRMVNAGSVKNFHLKKAHAINESKH